ncbi:MAG: cation transporter [Alphaproteobacteria bacterium]|nr:cation transporter [Alphaproteobacteria bacterium]
MILAVSTMTCGGCVRAITKTIQARDRHATVAADLAARRVSVETGLGQDEVLSVLAKAGHQAQPAPG